MNYLMVYASMPEGFTNPNVLPQIADICSRVDTAFTAILSREGDRSDLKQPVTGINDHELYRLTQKMDRLIERFKKGAFREIELREGVELVLPTREDRIARWL